MILSKRGFSRRLEHFFIFFILGLGLLLLLPACGGMPSAEEVPLPLATQDLPVPTQRVDAIPSIPEQRSLTLEFPPKIRAGDADTIRLTLEVDDLGNITPTAEIEGNIISGEVVEVADLYETHHIIAEAKIDMAGVQLVPAEMISQPLLRGEPAIFYWSLRPEEAGEYRGRVWLYLRFVPKDGGSEETRTISSQLVEISATTYLGFKAGPARIIGAIGTFFGAVLGLPFVDDVLKWLWEKFKKK